ncbi:MAG: O-antigen ligase family protein [Thermotogota bacterium]|nr:O-antigen ligase family protein [Thermotogota bacterium]
MSKNNKRIDFKGIEQGSFLKTIESFFLYFTFIFIAMFAHPKITYEFSTSKYLFLIIFFTISMTLFLFRKFKKREQRLYFSWAHFGWFLFGIAAVVSTFTVLRENPLYFPFSFEIGIYAFLTFFMVLYFSNFLETKRDITYFLLFVMISGTMVSIEALMNYYTGQSFFLGSYGSGGKMSIKATIGNPNFVSDFLATLLPITIYFDLSYDFGWTPKKEKPGFEFFGPIMIIKILGIINFAVFYFLVLVIGTRSVILSLMLSVVVFALAWIYYKRMRRKKEIVDNYKKIEGYSIKVANMLKKINFIFMIAIIFIALLLPILLSNPDNPLAPGTNIASRTSSIFDERGFQTTGGKARVLAWKASIYQFKEYPLIGNGIGTYMLTAVDYMGDAVQDDPEYIDSWSNFKRTHNDYFQVLGEMGLFGFISMAVTLILLIIMFFLILGDQKNPDDAILITLLATGFTVTLGHSFTEFPLHLLPNQLWALAVTGLGFGKYFNSKKRLAFNISLKGWRMPALITIVIVVGVVSGWLKLNSVKAEALFKEGNGYYSSFSQIERQESELKNQKNQVNQMFEQLENREGQYAIFDPNTYAQQKIAEMGSIANQFSEQELQVRLMNELTEDIEEEQQKLNNYIKQINDNLNYLASERMKRYNRAQEDFLSSLDSQGSYGKSMFYTSLMMVRPERKQMLYDELNTSSDKMETIIKHFTQRDESMRHIQARFLDFPLEEDVQSLQQLLDQGYTTSVNELLNLVNISLWYDIQMYQTGIDYFETSFLCFNEKNAYRIMGKFNYNLSVMLKNLSSRYVERINNDPALKDTLMPLITLHREQANEALKNMERWYERAIHILPGNWQMFPDWENIYSEYIDLLLKSGTVTEVYPKVKEIAQKRVWASEQMHNVQRSGVPDDIASVYSQIAQAFLENKLYQETIYVLDDGLNMLSTAYKWGIDDLENNPYLTDSEKQRYQNFISTVESLVEKRKTFLDQVTSVYRYAKEQGEFQDKWLEDWKYNQFTGETWEDANYDEIQERVSEAKENRPIVITEE